MTKFVVAVVLAVSLSTFSALAADKAPPHGKPIAPAGERKPDGARKDGGKPEVAGKDHKPEREKELAHDIGNFVQQMKDKGLRGQELADAIHKHLRALGIGEGHGKPGGDRDEDKSKGIGNFVREMHDKGLRGEELAAAIHAKLRERGVGEGHGKPGGDDNARGNAPEGKGPPPHAREMIPPQGGQGEKRGGPPFVPPGHRR